MNRYFLSFVAIGVLLTIPIHSMGSPLPGGTALTITAGVGGGTTSTSVPGTGSKFSMDAFGSGALIWTDISPGTQTGIIIGTTQSDGGQMTAASSTNSAPGQVDAAWKFFDAYGTDFTYATSLAPSGATANSFASATCASGLGTTACLDGSGGTTTLGSWSISWNFSNPPDGVPMGSGLIDAWIVSGSSYTLDYRQTVPNSSPVFVSIPYVLHLEGNIILPASPTPTPGTLYSLSVTINPSYSGGHVNLNPSGGLYTPSTVVTLTAYPGCADSSLQYFHFYSWSGDLTGTYPVASLTMDSNKNVTANYTTNPLSFCTPTVTNTLTPTITPTPSPTPTPTLSACEQQWPLTSVTTLGKAGSLTNNAKVSHVIIGNIVDPNSYGSTASKIKLCMGTSVTAVITDTTGTPSNAALTPEIVCSPTQCTVKSLIGKARYQSMSNDGTDTDRITLLAQ